MKNTHHYTYHYILEVADPKLGTDCFYYVSPSPVVEGDVISVDDVSPGCNGPTYTGPIVEIAHFERRCNHA